MNRKQLAILLVVGLVLGGGGLLLLKNRSASWQGGGESAGQKLLGNFDVNAIARIAIRRETNTVTLAKKDDIWRVTERGEYPANFSEISDLLLKLRDLKVVQTEAVGPSALTQLQLAPAGQGTNSGMRVEFADKDGKVIKTFLLGKSHMKKSDRPGPFGEDGGWPDGRWVKVADSLDVALITDPLSNVEPKPEQWLNREFFKIEKVRAVSVTFPNATNSWKITHESESDEWKLIEAKPDEKLDNGKAGAVVSPMSSPSFVDVSPGLLDAGMTGLTQPTIATLETFDGFTYTIKTGGKTNDQYRITMTVTADLAKERTLGKDEKPEDKEKLDKEFKEKQSKLAEKLKQEKEFEKWVYVVSSWTLDPLLKERAQLLVEKKSDAKPGDSKVENEPPVVETEDNK